MNPIIVKRCDVGKMVGLSYPTILKMEKEGNFPKRKQLYNARVGWLYAELEEWATNLSSQATSTLGAAK